MGVSRSYIDSSSGGHDDDDGSGSDNSSRPSSMHHHRFSEDRASAHRLPNAGGVEEPHELHTSCRTSSHA